MGVLRVASQKIILVRQVSSTLLEHINLDIVLSSLEEGRYSCFPIVYGVLSNCMFQGRIQGGGGGAHPVRAPHKIGKNMIFWRKIVIFHTKYPKNFAPPSARCNFFKCTPLT
jgi:hypothetical protein